MGVFIYKCLAVKNPEKPFKTRCKKKVGEIGVLCEECKEKAHKETVHVLMHREVTENYGIQFKNQVTVPIFLGDGAGNNKPESKFQADERKREMKGKLFEELRDLPAEEIRSMWDELNMGEFNPEGYEGEYKIHYYASKAIIDKFIEMS